MTAEDLRSELDKTPFIPFRLHLVSGRTIDVLTDRSAYLLRRSLLVLHDPGRAASDVGYNVVALRNIEMLEQLLLGTRKRQRGGRDG
jgi:hypothetical protein